MTHRCSHILSVPAQAAVTAQLVEVKKIWDAGSHNAFTDLVRGISGVEVVTRNGARSIAMHVTAGTDRCEPALFVDGAPLPPDEANLDALIPVAVVQAIEVYPRRIQAPAEYQSPTCGTVVVWTGARGWLAKRGRAKP